jgi:hypothetical protein
MKTHDILSATLGISLGYGLAKASSLNCQKSINSFDEIVCYSLSYLAFGALGGAAGCVMGIISGEIIKTYETF